MSSLRIATRNSPLALWQANHIKQKLKQAHPELEVDIIAMTTQGDQRLDRSLSTVGGKGLFLKELEVSLLNNQTDIAVHSMKDVPVSLPVGLEIAVVCERADARDAFVSNSYQNLYALPKGSRVGTSSLRRIAQLKHAFPKLKFVDLRGNINTRLAKLDDGEYDAIILASAGLIRLGFVHRIKQFITPELCLPAAGQGVIGIECRDDDNRIKDLLKPLKNLESELTLAVERAMNAALDGGCQAPIAAFAEMVGGKIRMRGMVGKTDGSEPLLSDISNNDLSAVNAIALGEEVAEELSKQGAKKILEGIRLKNLKGSNSSAPVVVLTRQQRYLGNSMSILETLDYQPISIQTLQVDPVFNEAVLKLFRNLGQFSDIIFVSRNAVEMGMSMIEQQDVKIPPSTQVMTVGAESAKQLYSYGIDAMFPDHGTGADALLSVGQLENLTDRNILVVRGVEGLTWPAAEMRKRGATVVHADVYIQSMPSNGAEQIQQLFKDHDCIDGIFLHSAMSAKNFMQLVRHDLDRFTNTVMVVGSERIAEVAESAGWKNKIRIAESPSNKHMMVAFSGNEGNKIS